MSSQHKRTSVKQKSTTELTQLKQQNKSDNTQSSFTASRRSQTGRRSTHALQAIWRPGNSTRYVSTVDRRSHGSPDPGDSPDVLEDFGSHRASSDTGRRTCTARPLRSDVEPRLTDCWGETTVGSTTSDTRTRRVLRRKHLVRCTFNVRLSTVLESPLDWRLTTDLSTVLSRVFSRPITRSLFKLPVTREWPPGTAIQVCRRAVQTSSHVAAI